MNNSDVKVFTQLSRKAQYKTNHILHLIFTIITGGFWSIVWVIVAISNANERRKCDKIIKGSLK